MVPGGTIKGYKKGESITTNITHFFEDNSRFSWSLASDRCLGLAGPWGKVFAFPTAVQLRRSMTVRPWKSSLGNPVFVLEIETLGPGHCGDTYSKELYVRNRGLGISPHPPWDFWAFSHIFWCFPSGNLRNRRLFLILPIMYEEIGAQIACGFLQGNF